MLLIRFLFFITRLSDIKSAFYTTNYGKIALKDVIHTTTARSLISCVQKCRTIDAAEAVIFEKKHCSCIKTGAKSVDNSEDMTLTGTIALLREVKTFQKVYTPKWRRIFQEKAEFAIKKDNLLTTIPKLTKEYIISFDVKITRWGNNFCNALHMTTGDVQGPYGSRTPSIAYNGRIQKLHVYSAVNNIGGSGYEYKFDKRFELDQWYNFNVSQMAKASGNIYYRITLDGKVFHSTINTSPTEFLEVKCYASNPWKMPQDGFIKNLSIYIKD